MGLNHHCQRVVVAAPQHLWHFLLLLRTRLDANVTWMNPRYMYQPDPASLDRPHLPFQGPLTRSTSRKPSSAPSIRATLVSNPLHQTIHGSSLSSESPAAGSQILTSFPLPPASQRRRRVHAPRVLLQVRPTPPSSQNIPDIAGNPTARQAAACISYGPDMKAAANMHLPPAQSTASPCV